MKKRTLENKSIDQRVERDLDFLEKINQEGVLKSEFIDYITQTHKEALTEALELVEDDKRLRGCYEGCKCRSRIKEALTNKIESV